MEPLEPSGAERGELVGAAWGQPGAVLTRRAHKDRGARSACAGPAVAVAAARGQPVGTCPEIIKRGQELCPEMMK